MLLAEVYDNQGTVGHSVDITTSLRAEGRVRVFANSETRSSRELGGASGGYTSGRKEIIDLLRQRSRPYLFSNSLAPVIAAASLRVLDRLRAAEVDRRRRHADAGRLDFGGAGPHRRRLDDAQLEVYVVTAHTLGDYARLLWDLFRRPGQSAAKS